MSHPTDSSSDSSEPPSEPPLSFPSTPPPDPPPSISPASSPQREPRSRSKSRRTTPRSGPLRHLIALTLLMATVGGAVAIWYHSHWTVTTNNAYVVGNITPVSAEVSGTVVALYTDDNMVVAAGDPIAQIDPVPYQLQVDQTLSDFRQATAEATAAEMNVQFVRGDRVNLLAGAESRRQEADQAFQAAAVEVKTRERIHQKEEESLAAVKSRVPGYEALARNAADYRDRFDRLAATGAVSIQERDNREATYREAIAKLEAIKNEVSAAERQVLASERQVEEANVRLNQAEQVLGKAKAEVGQAQAAQLEMEIANSKHRAAVDRVAQAEAKFRQAQLSLSNCLIRAPQTGTVSRRTIQLGQAVTRQSPFLSIVPLDPDNVWVVANFTEDQMARVRLGHAVRIKVDAVPDRTYEGWVESVSGGTGTVFSVFPADNATGNFTRVVQRLPVRIRFNGPQNYDMRVRPGLSSRVWVDESSVIRKGGGSW